MWKRTVVSVFWISLTSLCWAEFPEEGKPLSKEEEIAFLGDPRLTSLDWRKFQGVDFQVYYGSSKPPVSGEVEIYFGFAPPFPPLDRDSWTETPETRVGKFAVKWLRKLGTDGLLIQEAVVPIGPRHLTVLVGVKAKDQPRIDKIIAEISRLPTFATGKPPLGFEKSDY